MHARPAFPSAAPVPPDEGREIGRSREGRPVRAFRFAPGADSRSALRVSLLAGCHADEPVGPRTLRRLCGWLRELPEDHPSRAEVDWWIVPHANPDGAARNRAWQAEPGPEVDDRPEVDGRAQGEGLTETDGLPEAYDLALFLRHAVRELPGDDMEFGFPRGPEDERARPENRAVHAWWREAGGPFDLHASLHGMSFGAGPWFLLEPAWRDRTALLRDRCRERTRALGYRLHDVERLGEKGFLRLEPGFCTRPDSRAMRSHFLARGDPETAGRFRPSSMEAVRALGGDPLTLVSEMPLFLTPEVGRTLGPPDPAADAWRARLAAWRARLAGDDESESVRAEAAAAGLRPMPVRDQIDLQWTLIVAGLEQVRRARAR